MRSYSDFKKANEAITSKYDHWLKTEYDTSVLRARNAANFQKFSRDADLYTNLEWLPSTSIEVRGEHQAFYGIIKPINDPFWSTNYPGDLWNCKCGITNSDKEPSEITPKADYQSTPGLDENPSVTGALFSNTNAYVTNAYDGADKAVESFIKKEVPFIIKTEIKDLKGLNQLFQEFDKQKPGYFAKGFRSIQVERKAGNNGSTNRLGDIWLKKDRIENIRAGLNNIRVGKSTTLDQEDAMSTLWHEIMHNKNAISELYKRTKTQTYRMELANEFVSRKTLQTFFKELGGELQNIDLMNNRVSTGYNTMVRNYDSLIKVSKCNPEKVLSDVSYHLFNKSYNIQADGLSNAIINNSTIKIKEETVNRAIRLIDKLSEKEFESFLDGIK